MCKAIPLPALYGNDISPHTSTEDVLHEGESDQTGNNITS